MKILLTHGEHYNKKEKDNMIELSKFSKACKEVLEILNNVEEKDLLDLVADKLNISSVKGAIEQGGFSSSLIYFFRWQR